MRQDDLAWETGYIDGRDGVAPSFVGPLWAMEGYIQGYKAGERAADSHTQPPKQLDLFEQEHTTHA